jgi:hypothetical protein
MKQCLISRHVARRPPEEFLDRQADPSRPVNHLITVVHVSHVVGHRAKEEFRGQT